MSDSGSDSESTSGSSEASSEEDECRSISCPFTSPDIVDYRSISLIDDERSTFAEASSMLSCSSYATPVVPKKKVVLRTYAQIVADTCAAFSYSSMSSESEKTSRICDPKGF